MTEAVEAVKSPQTWGIFVTWAIFTTQLRRKLPAFDFIPRRVADLIRNPELVAESVVENLSFMARTEIAGKSHSSMLLVWNFMDTHFMSPVYLLETPIEINTFEFHP